MKKVINKLILLCLGEIFMFKKPILKIGLLTLGICLIAGCMNNKSSEIQEPTSNDSMVVEENNNKSNDVKKDDVETNKYNITSETYKKGNISVEYSQIKTKDGLDDDFTNKWNKILKDELIPNDVLNNSEPELEFFNLNYKVKTNDNNVISLLFPVSFCSKGSAHPLGDCNSMCIDISKNKKIELQDDPNFSKYVENIFYDKNYSLLYNSGEEVNKNEIKEIKKYFLEGLEKNDISKLKEQLKDQRFYYENGKTVIIFEAPHVYGDYVFAVME